MKYNLSVSTFGDDGRDAFMDILITMCRLEGPTTFKVDIGRIKIDNHHPVWNRDYHLVVTTFGNDGESMFSDIFLTMCRLEGPVTFKVTLEKRDSGRYFRLEDLREFASVYPDLNQDVDILWRSLLTGKVCGVDLDIRRASGKLRSECLAASSFVDGDSNEAWEISVWSLRNLANRIRAMSKPEDRACSPRSIRLLVLWTGELVAA